MLFLSRLCITKNSTILSKSNINYLVKIGINIVNNERLI